MVHQRSVHFLLHVVSLSSWPSLLLCFFKLTLKPKPKVVPFDFTLMGARNLSPSLSRPVLDLVIHEITADYELSS